MAQPPARRFGLGMWALVVALAGLVALSFLPTPYVIQRPGPVYDTLGTATAQDGTEVPLIAVRDAETFETEGSLMLTTIEIIGNRERPPSWFELALAWTDPSRAVVPIETIFPVGVTTDERNERNAILMDESQNEAKAAALRELGYEVGAQVEVVELTEGSPSEGLLEPGDRLIALNGAPLTSTTNLRAQVQDSGGDPVVLTVRRGEEELEIEVTPVEAGADGGIAWVIGTFVTTHYDFPIDVTIQLDNVGGPSAGLMFALGIVDQLTPGELTGGDEFAGTGTIDSEGSVGAIGGIRQKLYGARDSGAAFFFAPEANCAEVVGHVPDGLHVIRTATLDGAIEALEVIANDGDRESLPACTSAASQ